MNEDGAIIAAVRRLKNISQITMATDLQAGIDRIHRLEAGDPRVQQAFRARAAEYLGLTYDWAKGAVIPPANLPAAAWARPQQITRAQVIRRMQADEYTNKKPLLPTPEEMFATAQSMPKEDQVALVRLLAGITPLSVHDFLDGASDRVTKNELEKVKHPERLKQIRQLIDEVLSDRPQTKKSPATNKGSRR